MPSTYSEVFANPTMLASWSTLFGNPTALSGRRSSTPPAQTQPRQSCSHRWHRGRPGNQSVRYFRHPRSERRSKHAQPTDADRTLPVCAAWPLSLSLSVSDLILWIALTEGSPFGGAPAGTLEFLRRLTVLRGMNIAVHDLDYLLRDQSASGECARFHHGAVDRPAANDPRLGRQGGRGEPVGSDLGFQYNTDRRRDGQAARACDRRTCLGQWCPGHHGGQRDLRRDRDRADLRSP